MKIIGYIVFLEAVAKLDLLERLSFFTVSFLWGRVSNRRFEPFSGMYKNLDTKSTRSGTFQPSYAVGLKLRSELFASRPQRGLQ